ncbi:MAG: FHA domain-containing protein [Acidimicrobiales bacterium]|nr:FHA domain-containing protein [Acidimicrobiales bacterium]
MTLCANGHDSTTEDYCDTCGIKMGGAPGVGTAGPAGAAPASTTPTGTVTPDVSSGDCPNCGAPRLGGERFCEVCGLDFDTGAMPAPPQPVAATPPAATDPTVAGSPAPPPPGIGWVAVVAVDHGWWQDNSGAGGVADGVPFPDPVPAERRVALHQLGSVIGRTSGSSVADVDCGGGDTGVSRKHCKVTLGADGTWTLTDLGSTNGTFVGADGTRLTPQAETPYDPAAGPIKIGAYTVVRLEPEPTP